MFYTLALSMVHARHSLIVKVSVNFGQSALAGICEWRLDIRADFSFQVTR